MSKALRDIMLRRAWTLLDKPYRWGGDDPMAGFDCSGMILELAWSVGVLPDGRDMTANTMMHTLLEQGAQVSAPEPGDVVFYLNGSGFAYHVELNIGHGLTIGARGGGSRTKT